MLLLGYSKPICRPSQLLTLVLATQKLSLFKLNMLIGEHCQTPQPLVENSSGCCECQQVCVCVGGGG